MDAETREHLRAVNHRFYDRFANDFSDSRQRAWPGWQRVCSHLPITTTLPAVLDVGCGNARFASFLSSHWRPDFRYVGLDGSAELLRQAQARSESVTESELLEVDILADNFETLLGDRRFQVVALFGVLHHIPGRKARRDLLCRLTARLAPGGLLAMSIWRLDQSPKFGRKVIPWEAYRAHLEQQREPTLVLDLDPGDVLLKWAGQSDVPRYCHFPDDVEIDTWIEDAKPPLADRFAADGPTGQDNLYLLFRQSPTAE